jgi:hypothetical protein
MYRRLSCNHLYGSRVYNFNLEGKMKANKIQQYICDVINSQQDFWKHSNDITSLTHISDIEEECKAQFGNLLSDEEIEKLVNKLSELYWFVRKFDDKE